MSDALTRRTEEIGAYFSVDSMALQSGVREPSPSLQYTPPLVGYTEQISASDAAMQHEINETSTH